ncbi:hypothetical protein T02_3206 [Trichinella nativa]|uniref:Uncharacterized protein n=1 Tax=Trichinella nativa TaxID=6335 RepID=A0A0V1KPP1_9BILA|nr:hypothetical protein T02_3206 [Trichinella nativa]
MHHFSNTVCNILSFADFYIRKRKLCKEGVTVYCCANTTRSDRSQLLIKKRPRAVMIGMEKLPMAYDYQPKVCWML